MTMFPNGAVKEEARKLLKKELPQYRQAYSDRTAWLMSCLSELAYLRFNPLILESVSRSLPDTVGKLVSEGTKSSLTKLIGVLQYDSEEEKKELEESLQILGLEILKTFDSQGTQAILVSSSEFLVLAFRGTEATCLRDIKTDMKATLKQCADTDGDLHVGFSDAFDAVRYDIEDCLEECGKHERKPLFITGHSLGGALASIATKKLNYPYITACYSFGSPRVGDDLWITGIKAPIYRVVNAADCVTMLPPGVIAGVVTSWLFTTLLKRFMPSVGNFLLKRMGYMHVGDMRYLTNCKGERSYQNVRLLYSVSLMYRLWSWFREMIASSFIKDHSISVYRKKLFIIAMRKNPG